MRKALTILILLIVALALATLWQGQRRAKAAFADFPPEGQFVEVQGTKVHVKITGSGPDLMLIHGASGNLRDMGFGLTEALAQDYRVIAVDRPGLGHTPPTDDMSIAAQASLLADVASALGADKPLVVGQSYGGAVGLAWAVHHPDRIAGLITLGSPSLPWDTPLDGLYRLNTHPVLKHISIPLLAAWVPEGYVKNAIKSIFAPQAAPDGYADAVGAPLSLTASALRANAAQRAHLLDEIKALEPRYPDLTLPIELVHGDADTIVGLKIHSEPLSARIASANLVPLPGIGHMPHHVARDAVIDAVHRAAERSGLR